jgi:hypothetical protein
LGVAGHGARLHRMSSLSGMVCAQKLLVIPSSLDPRFVLCSTIAFSSFNTAYGKLMLFERWRLCDDHTCTRRYDSDDDSDDDAEELVNADAYFAAEKASGKRKRDGDVADESPMELAKKIRSAAALAGEDDESDDDESDDEEEEEEEEEEKVAITEELHAQKLAEYLGSNEEKTDLVANYNKCGGDWDLIMHFQAAAEDDKSEITRLKKIIKKERKNKKVKSFSAKDTAKIVAELKATMDEADLSAEEEEEEEEEEADAEEAEELASFIEDDEDNAIEGSEEDESDDDDGPCIAVTPTSHGARFVLLPVLHYVRSHLTFHFCHLLHSCLHSCSPCCPPLPRG